MTAFRGFLSGAAAVAILAVAGTAYAGTSSCNVTITATVDAFAEWSAPTAALDSGDWTSSGAGSSISLSGQYLTAARALTLYSNTNVTVSATAGASNGVATNGSDTLATAYQITGDVTAPDVDYKAAGAAAGQFFNSGNTYTVNHVTGDGSYVLNLLAKLTAAGDRAQGRLVHLRADADGDVVTRTIR